MEPKKQKTGKSGLQACLLVLLLFAVPLFVYGVYYFQDFTAASPAGWVFDYQYGRGGVTRTPDSHTITVNTGGSGTLEFRGVVNTGDSDYLGVWAGRMAFYTNQSFVASATNPFGVEFRRTFARLDPHNDTSNPESHRHQVAQSFWLVQAPSFIDDTTADGFTTYPNAIVMYEMMRMDYNMIGGQPRSSWGYSVVSEQPFDMTAGTDNSGVTRDLTANIASGNGVPWNYDDMWGAGTQGGGTANGTADNNNSIIVRLTHDSSYVRMYINPDPDNANTYPNEFILVQTVPVSWNSDIRVMTGVESKRTDTETQDADIDSMLIRSVSSGVTAEITPARVAKGTTNWYEIVLNPTFSADDAGIGEIVISKSDRLSSFNWDPSAIQVYSVKGTGGAHSDLTALQEMTYSSGSPASTGHFYAVATNGGKDLFIKFSQADNSLTTTGVINSNAADKRIVVRFQLAVPESANADGDQFAVYVDSRKYDGELYPRWATTGRQQAAAGDAVTGTYFTENTLTVKSFANPDLLGTLTPELIYVGANKVLYYYVSLTNQNAPGLSKLSIKVPQGYDIETNDSSGFTSLFISDDSQYVYATNINGTNYVVADYKSDGSLLPSPGGLDRITVPIKQTPGGFTGAQTNTLWSATGYSDVSGTVPSEARTNTAYPNNVVIVRQPPPQALVNLSTAEEGSTNTLYNHTVYNSISYTIENSGDPGNLVKLIQLQFPEGVTNINSLTSGLTVSPSYTFDQGTRILTLDYTASSTNIPAGLSDTLTFNMYDSVPAMSGLSNGSITAAVNNLNGDGYVNASTNSTGWTVTWKNPLPEGKGSVVVQNSMSDATNNLVYTTDDSYQLRFYINNNGDVGNELKLVEIVFPAQITNISFVNATVLNDGANIEQSGNRVLIKYYNDTSSAISNSVTELIGFQVADSITLSQVTALTMQIRVGNTTNTNELRDSALYTPGLKSIAYITPPVSAAGYSYVEADTSQFTNLIDSSTITNTIVYTLSNSGVASNVIGEVRLYIPDSVSSNLLNNAASAFIGSTSDVSPYISVDNSGYSNFVRVVYPNGSKLAGGETDTIRFTMIDHIENESNFQVVASVSNIQHQWTTVPLQSGRTNTVYIKIPPARAALYLKSGVVFASTNGTVTEVMAVVLSNSASGINNITNVEILYPTLLSGNMTDVSNTSGAPSSAISGGYRFDYSSSPLETSQTDTIYFVYENNFSSSALTHQFSGTVDNGQGAQSIDLLSGQTVSFKVVDQPRINIVQNDSSPNTIYTTDTVSDFVITLKNGSAGGASIQKAKIIIPYPFVTNDMVYNSPTAGAVESLSGSNLLIVDYSNIPLNPGSVDNIAVQVKDVLTEGVTNVNWQVLVDYGDGSGYRSTAVADGLTNGISFIFPEASAWARIQPRNVNMNSLVTGYTLSISNIGVAGNHIKKVTIDAGATVTNISNVQSAISNVGVSVVSNRYIVLDYTVADNLLTAPGMDVVSYFAFDSVTTASNDSVSVLVANSGDDIDYRSAVPYSTGSLDISFYQPDYLATAYLLAANAVSTESTNTIYSSVTASTLLLKLRNSGGAGNNLEVLKLEIPDPWFTAASIRNISSEKVSSNRIVLSNTTLYVYYTNGEALESGVLDTLSFVIDDVVSLTNGSVLWNSSARFSTSEGQFIQNQATAGKTNRIYFQMPDPSAAAALEGNSFYTTSGNIDLAVAVTNTGRGENPLFKVELTVPPELRSGLSQGSVSNSSATSIQYSAGKFTLLYSGMDPGQDDRFSILLTNTVTSLTTVQFSAVAYNSLYNNSITAVSNGALTVRIDTPPQATLNKTNVDSSTVSNQFKLRLENNSSGLTAVKQVRITVPAVFTNVVSVASSIGGATVTNSGNLYFVTYPGVGLARSSVDTVTVTVYDGVTDTDLSADWSVAVDNGTGFASAYNAAGALTTVFTMPQPDIAASIISGNKLYTSTGLFDLSIRVTNRGSGINRLKQLHITLPENVRDGFSTNAVSLTAATNVSYSAGVLTLIYSGLDAGQSDVVNMNLSNNYQQSSRITWGLSAENLTRSAAVSPVATGALLMAVDTPPAAVVEPGMLDTTTLSNVVSLKINNNSSGDSAVIAARIQVPALFTNVIFLSNQSGVSMSNSGNIWFADYSAQPLQLDEQDILWFLVSDSVISGNIETEWRVEIDNGTGYAPVALGAVDSLSNVFQMPAPEATASVKQKEIYTTTASYQTVVAVSNSGSGSNNLNRIEITIPANMRDGFTVAKISNSAATNSTYNSGVLTLFYSGFVPGAVDNIYFNLTNRYLSSGTVSWVLSADNGTRTATVSPAAPESLQQNIITPPSASVTVVNPRDGVVNRIYSTDYQGAVQVELRHDGSGTTQLRQAMISFPAGFVVNGTSSRVGGGWISNITPNKLLIDYQGGGAAINPSESDQLLLTVIDPFNSGVNNVDVDVKVPSVDPNGLNGDFTATRTASGKTMTINYIHPQASASWKIGGFGNNDKPSVLVASKRIPIMETNLQITVKNNGEYSNVLHNVSLNIPAVFSTVEFLSNSVSGASVSTNGNSLTVNYPSGLSAGSNDTIHFGVTYTQQEETNNLPVSVTVDNSDGSGSVPADLMENSFSTLDIKYSPVAVFAGLRNSTNVYTLNTNSTLVYLIKNRAQGYKITETLISNFDMSPFSQIEVLSEKGGTVQVLSSSNMIRVSYPVMNLIDYNDSDSLTINLTLKTNLGSGYNSILTMENVTWLSNPNPPDYKSTNIDARTLEAIDTDIGSTDNQRFLVGPAPYSVLNGIVTPTFKIDTRNSNTVLPNIVKVELLAKDSDTVITTPYAEEVGADGTPQNKSLLTYSEPTAGGAYYLEYLPPGEYRLRYSSTGFQKIVTNVTLTANEKIEFPQVSLRNSLLDSGVNSEQMVVNYEDTNTRFILPENGMIDQFGLNISIVDMSAAQQAAVQSASSVLQPGDVSSLRCFKFDIFNRLGSSLSGLGIGGDGKLVLNYSNMNLQIPIYENTATPDDWQSSQLAVYYWKAATSTWVPIGGTVNQSGGVVTAKVNYLHDYYALLAVNPGVAAKKIYNVTATPKVFTPGHGDESVNTMKLTFSFSQPHQTYTVSIFDMRGRLVRKFVRDGSYSQGEVFWDGKDENGFKLAGGVYLYQIKAGGEIFTGTVLMLK